MVGRPNRKGFTLIELMAALAVVAIMVPLMYRFYHEGVRKEFVRVRESTAACQAGRVLFKYLARDIKHSRGLVDSFGRLGADADQSLRLGEEILMMRAVSPRERFKFLGREDEPAPPGRPAVDCVIVYRFERENKTVRRIVVYGRSAAKDEKVADRGTGVFGMETASSPEKIRTFIVSSTTDSVLVGHVAGLRFHYSPPRPASPHRIKVSLALADPFDNTRVREPMTRIFFPPLAPSGVEAP